MLDRTLQPTLPDVNFNGFALYGLNHELSCSFGGRMLA
jgi:hypothetical protein